MDGGRERRQGSVASRAVHRQISVREREKRGRQRFESGRGDAKRCDAMQKQCAAAARLSWSARVAERTRRGHGAAGNRFVAATAGGDGGIECRAIKLEQRVLFGPWPGRVRGEGKHVGSRGCTADCPNQQRRGNPSSIGAPLARPQRASLGEPAFRLRRRAFSEVMCKNSPKATCLGRHTRTPFLSAARR